jgi:glycerate kinase
MNIVVAPDSFKESLSAKDVALAIARGIKRVLPDVTVRCIPMADGGEGTVDAVIAATHCERRITPAQDALGQPRQAEWAWLPSKTAVIEMATAAGLELIRPEDRDVMRSSSYGVGELIRFALDQGAEHIVLGLGGSATNDAGAGMLQALGLKMQDSNGQALEPGGAALIRLAAIDASALDPRLKIVRVTIASDVDNPLCGPHGASAIFGPQKGATPEQVQQLDSALSHFADLVYNATGLDFRDHKGSGAAGGLGFAAHSFMNASFRPGVDVIAELGDLAKAIEGSSLVLTGEGRMDAQTLHGKTPMGVAQIAKRLKVPVIAIAGSLGIGYKELYGVGIQAAFSLTNGPMTLAQACQDCAQLLEDRTEDVIRVWLAGQSVNQV